MFEIKSIEQFGNYIYESFQRILIYVLVIILIYVSFAIFAQNLWGQYHEKFKDFPKSLENILLFSIGNNSYIFTLNFNLLI